MANVLLAIWTIVTIGGLYYFEVVTQELGVVGWIYFMVVLITGFALLLKYKKQWDVWAKFKKRW